MITIIAEPLFHQGRARYKLCAQMGEECANENPGTAEKIRSVDDQMLPAIDCNVLYGASAIARWLGMTIGQCKPLLADETIPTFRPPGRKALCALKTEVNAAWAEYARRFRAKER